MLAAMTRQPQPSDADLILKLYDLRRETVMRQARAWMGGFLPKSFDELKKVLAPDHPQNAFYRQVTSYWEMVGSFVNRCVLPPDMYADSCGEALFVYARLEPYLKELRASYSPTSMLQTERCIADHASIRDRWNIIRERVWGKR